MVLACLASGLAYTTPADALTVDVSCLGSTTIDYHPGLLLTPQLVQYSETDQFSSCTSVDPTLTAGSLPIEASLVVSCLEPLGTGDGRYIINWNNLQSSTIDATFTVTLVGGTLTSVGSGVVVSGAFAGSNAQGVFTYVQPNLLQCLAPPGLTHQNGTATLLITHG
jgi:hypothetical protein